MALTSGPWPAYVLDLPFKIASNLEQIHVQLPFKLSRDGPWNPTPETSPINLLWTRETNASGDSDDFVPSHLRYWVICTSDWSDADSQEPSERERGFLSRIKSLRLDYHEEFELESGRLDLTPFLRACSSIVALELSLPFAHSDCCDAALIALASLPKTVEGLRICIQYIWPLCRSNHRTRFGRMDRLLADALTSLQTRELSLRAVTMHVEIHGEDVRWALNPIKMPKFPDSSVWCVENSILFDKLSRFCKLRRVVAISLHMKGILNL